MFLLGLVDKHRVSRDILEAIPANQTRFSRFRGTVQRGPVQQQETQIVQPRLNLDYSLP